MTTEPRTKERGISRWEWAIFFAVCLAVIVNLILASMGIAA